VVASEYRGNQLHLTMHLRKGHGMEWEQDESARGYSYPHPKA
jgi:hypothetical protein